MVPGPAKQFDRDEALQKAMGVFGQSGFAGTSFEQIVEATGVNRSSIYATFGDKQALFEEALQLYVDRGLAMLTDQVRGQGSPLAGIESGLRMIEKKALEHGFTGCLCGNASAEFGTTEPGVARIVKHFYNRFERVFRDALVDARAAGEIPAHVDPKHWGRMILVLTQGLSNVVKGSGDSTIVSEVVDGLLAELRGEANESLQ